MLTQKNAARKEEQDEEPEVFFFHHCLTWLGVILKLEQGDSFHGNVK